MKSLVIVPTYNEAENIRELLPKVLALPVNERVEVLVVDDNSTDGTGAIADEMAQADDRIDLEAAAT